MINKEVKVEVKGTMPYRGSVEATGYDIRVKGDHVIKAGQTLLMPTQTSVSVPENVICIALPRSGICKRGLIMTNSIGLIDPDYLGIIHFSYTNVSGTDVKIHDTERLGQLVFIESLVPKFIPVKEFTKKTERGESGFGSTGRM